MNSQFFPASISTFKLFRSAFRTVKQIEKLCRSNFSVKNSSATTNNRFRVFFSCGLFKLGLNHYLRIFVSHLGTLTLP